MEDSILKDSLFNMSSSDFLVSCVFCSEPLLFSRIRKKYKGCQHDGQADSCPLKASQPPSPEREQEISRALHPVVAFLIHDNISEGACLKHRDMLKCLILAASCRVSKKLCM